MGQSITKVMTVLDKIEGDRSVCFCGHTGDKAVGSEKESHHDGVNGHGPCSRDCGDCRAFVWRR